jgi:type II secretion system protein G
VLKQLWAILNRPKATRGFTLIELLVVVAIIGLLAAFAVPKLFEAINKAKAAPGQADMQTISAALERFYFEKGYYPKGANFVALKSDLTTYLKSSTKFANGYGKGYFYGTNANGTGYVLIDYKDTTATFTLTCQDKDAGDPDVSVPVPALGTPPDPVAVNTLSVEANLATCTVEASQGVSLETN